VFHYLIDTTFLLPHLDDIAAVAAFLVDELLPIVEAVQVELVVESHLRVGMTERSEHMREYMYVPAKVVSETRFV